MRFLVKAINTYYLVEAGDPLELPGIFSAWLEEQDEEVYYEAVGHTRRIAKSQYSFILNILYARGVHLDHHIECVFFRLPDSNTVLPIGETAYVRVTPDRSSL